MHGSASGAGRWARRGVAFVALAQASARAEAHGSVRGLGNFLNGALHPLLEPAQLIALIALGLLIAQRGLQATRPAAWCFVAALALGLAAAGIGGAPTLEPALLPLAGLLGVAVLADLAVPRFLCATAAGIVGLGVGLGSDPESAAGSARVVMLLGSGAGAAVALFNIVGFLHEARRHWQRIGMRVVGSWIAASVALVLALSLAGPARPARLSSADAAAGPTAAAEPKPLDPPR